MYGRMPFGYYNEAIDYPETQKKRSSQLSTRKTRQDVEVQPVVPFLQEAKYSQNWLTEQLGKYIKVEFLIGTSMLIDREGVLKEVGVNYIVLKESGTKDDLMCDMYSIKFVRVFDDQEKAIIC